MYHVIGIGVTAIIIYLISYTFYRTGFFSLSFHKRIWNLLLAVTFISTAIAGLFMALQLNYKWDLPFIKPIVKLHAEFGIGMAFTGIIHFIWHFSYFKKPLTTQDPDPSQKVSHIPDTKEIRINLFIIGFVSSAIQLLLLREMMNITGGYELIAGIFLGSWLVSSSFGAYLARKSPLSSIRIINIVFSLSPLISVILLFLLARIFLNPGESPSLLLSLFYTFLVLMPFCLVSGFTFIKLISIARSGNGILPGKSFSIETSGGIVSGILISISTSGLLSTYKLILLVILFSVSYVLLTYFIKAKRKLLLTRVLVLPLAIIIIISNPDILVRKILLPGISVTNNIDTPYGNIVMADYHGENSLYYNQRLIEYNNDVVEREESVHYAMLQRPTHKKVMLVSGSLNSLVPELSKYSLEKVCYIERDPALIKLQKEAEKGLIGELIVVNSDAFSYIRQAADLFDAIILLIPPPSTLLINRYYTTEFFRVTKEKLNSDGVFMCSPGAGDNYFNKESLDLYSSIYKSLNTVFKYVRPVVGNKLYFIASDEELSVSFVELSGMRDITNIYVGPDYLSDDLILQKSEELISLLNKDARQNRFAFPIASFYFQSYYFSRDIDEKTLAIVLIIAAFALPVLSIKRRNILMYFSASALAGFEIIILLSIQLIFGNIYHLTGIIIAGLMAGLAFGASADFRILKKFSLWINGLILISIYLIYGLLYNNISSISNNLPAMVLIISSSFLPSFFTGHIFMQLTRKDKGSGETSAVYISDLAGSAFGFVFLSAIVIPVLGIRISLYLLAALIFTGIVFGTNRNL